MEQSYKEKYEQALSKAKDMLNYKEVRREDMEYIFPELAESEGEKVRKALIDFFGKGAKYGSQTNGVYDKDILAWLEKQGEKHPDPYNGISFEYNGHIWGMCARDNGVDILCDKHLIKHLEEQSEKPADKVEPKFKVKYAGSKYNVLEVKDIAGVTYYGIEDEPNHIDYVLPNNCEIVSEQKPAEQQMYWTEEEIEPIISDYLCGREHYGGMIGRLCHLKPKQKQTEWSEDDKAFLDDILCKLEHDLILNKDEKDWLKSLRPQNRWKPSDEQMEALDWQVENTSVGSWQYKATKELLADLKKLKEGKV